LPKTAQPINPRRTTFAVEPQSITLRTPGISLSVRARDGHTTVIFTTETFQYSAVINHIGPVVVQNYETFTGSTNSTPSTGSPRPRFPTPFTVEIIPPPLANGASDEYTTVSEGLNNPALLPQEIHLGDEDLDSLNPADN